MEVSTCLSESIEASIARTVINIEPLHEVVSASAQADLRLCSSHATKSGVSRNDRSSVSKQNKKRYDSELPYQRPDLIEVMEIEIDFTTSTNVHTSFYISVRECLD